MDEHIVEGQDAINQMVEGASKLAKIVSSTLGPDGKVVFMEHPSGIPLSTKDGATVASWFQLENKIQNMGATVVKFAANKTAAEAGDATTTTTILAEEFIHRGTAAVADGANARKVIKGMNMAKEEIVKKLTKKSKAITAKSPMVKSIAMVSSNFDEELATLISTVVKSAGKGAVINIDKNIGGETKMEYQRGMTVMSRYAHPAFVNTSHNEVILDNVLIILCDYEVSKIKEIGHIFGTIEGSDRMPGPGAIMRPGIRKKVDSYLFIAKDVQGEALSSLVKSKVERGSKVAIATAPYGDDFDELIRDLALFTGGKVVAENEGSNMENMNVFNDSGWASRIILTRDNLTIIDGMSDETELENRKARLNNSMEDHKGTKTAEVYRERIARLEASVAKLTIGGENEANMTERADRAEDAVHAVRSAMEEGVVPGGGVSWLRVMEHSTDKKLSEDERKGYSIVVNAMMKPIYTILENSGYDDDEASAIVHDIIHSENGVGFNILSGKQEDLMKSGIIDPVKVLRCAIENAVMVATQIMTTGSAMHMIQRDGDK
jgi:chaperonin GroEL